MKVLIETLWNVKSGKRLEEKLFLCFNRNIVECKVIRLSSIIPVKYVLIETLWNVK